jgi:UDP-N-acetylmuramyl pentapeptide phosphotransferase/UDP-N-acetylglucosamine-1-phosphate transferase
VHQASLASLATFAPFAAALASFLLIRWLLASAIARHFADHPNDRSLHASPVPRTGGIGIMAGVALGGLMVGWGWVPVGLALALAAVSLVDDWRGLPIAARFGMHFVAAALLLVHVAPPWPWWVVASAAVAIVWMTNLYNFMDGSDGLAGGMALFGFGSYAVAAALGSAPALALLAGSIATAAAAFLAFNFHPARVFMGDAGSIPLGFLAAALGCVGYVEGLWAAWFPLAVFSPFVLDATVTLARRAARGERVWQAHRKHYYQRMVRIGWGHARVAQGEYAVMAIVGGVSVAALGASAYAQASVIAAILAAYAAFALWFDGVWARRPAEIAE